MIRLRRNALLIISILISSVVIIWLISCGRLDTGILLTQDKAIHFNLLTVNAIIAGFMFTSLGLMVSVSGHFMIKELERANHMSRVYNNIIAGIVCTVISILISLIFIFSIIDLATSIAEVLASAEIIGLVLGVITLAISMIDLKFVINIFRQDENNKISDELIQRLKDKMNVK